MPSPRIPLPIRVDIGRPRIPSIDDIEMDDIAVILRTLPEAKGVVQVVGDVIVEARRREAPERTTATAVLDLWVLNPISAVSYLVGTETLRFDAGALTSNVSLTVDVAAYAGEVVPGDYVFFAATLSHQTRGDVDGTLRRDSNPRNDAAVMLINLGQRGPQTWSRA